MGDDFNPLELKVMHLHLADYIVFALLLILSTATGVYFGYFKRKKVQVQKADGSHDPMVGKLVAFADRTLSEYLLGSRNLSTFPVAMSLVASYISGVTVLGTPSEIYNYGTQYWMICVAIIFMAITVSKVYLPVFCKLRVGSSYEYLEARFHSNIRTLASFMFVMDEIFFLPIILYVPGIAFNQVTGINLHIITSIICIACVFYTLIGGIKAVVHTDAWQVFVMFVSVIVVVILGSIYIGGPSVVFDKASEGGRLIFFDMNPSLYKRHTFWGSVIGGFVYWTSFNSVNQTMVQRYMSLPTYKKAARSMVYFAIGIIIFVSICTFAGLLIYAFYAKCDPMSAGLIENNDQLFPIYVMQTVGHLHGVPGLFIAGVFGAALSSLSVVLNSTSLVLLQDIIKGCFKVPLSAKASGVVVKTSVVVLGIIALSLVFVVQNLGAILSVATSVTAIAASTSFGMFTLGMLVPWSNTIGTAVGAVSGMMMSAWVAFGIQGAVALRAVMPIPLELSCSGCPEYLNCTLPEYPDESDVFPLYRLSFHWVNPIGVITVLVVGTIVSLLTGPTKLKDLDPDLISPVIHRFLPAECFSSDVMTREATLQTLHNSDGTTPGSSNAPSQPTRY